MSDPFQDYSNDPGGFRHLPATRSEWPVLMVVVVLSLCFVAFCGWLPVGNVSAVDSSEVTKQMQDVEQRIVDAFNRCEIGANEKDVVRISKSAEFIARQIDA